jgi:hypothetical protein
MIPLLSGIEAHPARPVVVEIVVDRKPGIDYLAGKKTPGTFTCTSSFSTNWYK